MCRACLRTNESTAQVASGGVTWRQAVSPQQQVASGGVTKAASGSQRHDIPNLCQHIVPGMPSHRVAPHSATQEAHGSTWPAVHVARGGRVDGRVGSVNARHARRATSGADDRQRGVSVIAVGRLKPTRVGAVEVPLPCDLQDFAPREIVPRHDAHVVQRLIAQASACSETACSSQLP